MKKLLLLIVAVTSFASLKPGEPEKEALYSKELMDAVQKIVLADPSGFHRKIEKCAARRKSGGTDIACIQSVLVQELKKQNIDFDEFDAQSFAADMWIESMLQSTGLKKK